MQIGQEDTSTPISGQFLKIGTLRHIEEFFGTTEDNVQEINISKRAS